MNPPPTTSGRHLDPAPPGLRLGACGLLVLWLAAGLLTGCATTGPGSRSSRNRIDEINLLCAPAAINFDGVPGADGLSLRIYASNSQQPKSQGIARGTLEILLFDGLAKDVDLQTGKPLRVWSYPAAELAGFAQKTSIGLSYVLTPLWGTQRPPRAWVTVVARYLPPEGGPLYSGPATVFVSTQ